MTYEGEWKEGQHISFFDKTQGGTKVLVESVVPNETIRMRHVAMVNPQNMEVALTDEMMRKWIGTREDYYFKRAHRERGQVLNLEFFWNTFSPWPARSA